MFVGCEKDILIMPDKPDKQYDLGDVLRCSTPSNYSFGLSYKWTDSNGVIVSNTSTMTLTGEGSFNLTCTIFDERPACSVLSRSINGHIGSKFISYFVIHITLREFLT